MTSPTGDAEQDLFKITPNFCSLLQGCARLFRRSHERVRTVQTGAAQRKRTPNVAMPQIFLPLDFAATITTPERGSGSNDLTLPVNSISQPSLADTIAGADSRTA